MTYGDGVDNQLEIAYLGIEVPDPSSLAPFFTDVIGLVPGEPRPDGTLTWRSCHPPKMLAEDEHEPTVDQAVARDDAVTEE